MAAADTGKWESGKGGTSFLASCTTSNKGLHSDLFDEAVDPNLSAYLKDSDNNITGLEFVLSTPGFAVTETTGDATDYGFINPNTGEANYTYSRVTSKFAS